MNMTKIFGLTYHGLSLLYKQFYDDFIDDDVRKRRKISNQVLSCQKKFGGKSSLADKRIHKKTVESRINRNRPYIIENLRNYDYELVSDYEGIRDSSNKNFIYDIKCLRCGSIFKEDIYLIPKCPGCISGSDKISSKREKFYSTFLNDLVIKHSLNKRDVVPWIAKRKQYGRNIFHELDIYLPEYKIAFEINGLYTHCSNFTPYLKNGKFSLKSKDKYYHQQKTLDCLKQGIKLYHIWEDDNQKIIKSKILILLELVEKSSRFYARKAEIVSLSIKQERVFFDENHLHGYAVSLNDLTFGLEINQKIISVISFRRVSGSVSNIELARFATIKGHIVIGGFSKLLKHAIPLLRKQGIKKILTYAYTDWTPDPMQSVYTRLGFDFKGLTIPSMTFYKIGDRCRISRQKYQKHKLKKLFPDLFNNHKDEWDNLSGQQLLSMMKIYPVYDSGNYCFQLML